MPSILAKCKPALSRAPSSKRNRGQENKDILSFPSPLQCANKKGRPQRSRTLPSPTPQPTLISTSPTCLPEGAVSYPVTWQVLINYFYSVNPFSSLPLIQKPIPTIYRKPITIIHTNTRVPLWNKIWSLLGLPDPSFLSRQLGFTFLALSFQLSKISTNIQDGPRGKMSWNLQQGPHSKPVSQTSKLRTWA